MLKYRPIPTRIAGEEAFKKNKNCAPKNDKNAPKITKRNCAKITLFFLVLFRIYSLKIFEGGGLGAWLPIAPDYAAMQTTRCINF